MLRYLLLIFVLSFNSFNNLNALFDLSKLAPGGKKVEFGFDVDSLRSQKEGLRLEVKNEKIFYNDFLQKEHIITEKLNNIGEELLKIDNKLKTSTEDENEYLLKYVSFLNERKQTLIGQLDVQKETLVTIKENIKTIRIIINTRERPVTEKLSSSYSWREFQEIAKNLSVKITQKKNELKKKQALEEQKETKKKFLESNKNQREKKKEQLLLLEEEISKGVKDKSRISRRALLKEEISLLEEKNSLYEFIIKKFEEQIKLNGNEVKLLEIELEVRNKELKEIEKNILPTPEDVNLTKQAWNLEVQKSQKEKDEWEKRKVPIKLDIERCSKELNLFIRQEKIFKEEANQVKIILIDSKIQKLKTIIEEKNKRLKVINSEKERLDMRSASKKLQFEIINAYYQSSIDKSMIKDWLQNLMNQKGLSDIQIQELQRKLDEEVSAQPETLRKLEQIKIKKEDLNLKKDTVFKGNSKIYYEVVTILNDTRFSLNNIQGLSLNNLTIISDQIKFVKQMINSYDFTIKQLEEKSVSDNIWRRSTKAISLVDLTSSLGDAEHFLKKIFWDTPNYIAPSNIISFIKRLSWPDYLGLFLFIVFFTVFLFGIKRLILFLLRKVKSKIENLDSVDYAMKVYSTLNSLLEFSLNNFKLLFIWFFIYLHILFDFKYIFSSIEFMANSYVISVFYLITIPVWLYLSSSLLIVAKELNTKLSFLFFSEKAQTKFIFLLTSILYSTVILIPLRQAFLNYVDIPSAFPNLILAAYSLILVGIILFFFGKEDVLALIPANGTFFIWLRNNTEKYYYPVFVFCMGLLVLTNPYIGYSNLAWYLAFAFPGTFFIFYLLFLIHSYVRKYSSTLFLKEENEEIVDKFEQAKVYYGFFIILTFLALSFFSFVLITRIWQLNYTPVDLWKTFSQNWVIRLSDGAHLGIVEFLTLISFILGGYLISSLLKKFVFNKLFDIFRTEPGAQNTMFRIAHYIIITMAFILGFAAIQLKDFVFWAGSFLAVGIGFALKDLVADYVCGLFILIERPFEIGNFIQLDEKTIGTVQKISARATTLRTARNFSIIVPNKDLVSKQLINWGHGRMSVGFELKILVDYGQNFELIKDILQKTIETHEAVLKVPGITIRIDEFGENGILFFMRSFISSRKVRDQWQISSEIRFAIIKAFRENHITIAYPQMVVHKAIYSKEQRGIKSMKGIDIKFDEGIERRQEVEKKDD